MIYKIVFFGIILSIVGCILLIGRIESDIPLSIPLSVITLGVTACIIGGYLFKNTNKTVEIKTNTEIGIIQIYDTQGNLIKECKVQH